MLIPHPCAAEKDADVSTNGPPAGDDIPEEVKEGSTHWMMKTPSVEVDDAEAEESEGLNITPSTEDGTLSDTLIIHFHGGGFVAHTSKVGDGAECSPVCKGWRFSTTGHWW
jgi:hypothetical protein